MSADKTKARAAWLKKYAEDRWALACDEEDRWQAQRLFECAEDLLRFHNLKNKQNGKRNSKG